MMTTSAEVGGSAGAGFERGLSGMGAYGTRRPAGPRYRLRPDPSCAPVWNLVGEGPVLNRVRGYARRWVEAPGPPRALRPPACGPFPRLPRSARRPRFGPWAGRRVPLPG